MSKFCERQGHARSAGTENVHCLNCGIALAPEPEARGHADVMEATAGLEDALARAELKHQGEGKPETKPSNPKDAIGASKLPMHLVPTAVTRYASLSFLEGALKYGKYNWRVAGVRMSIYLDAIHRHLGKLQDGEWADGDSLPPNEDGSKQGTQVPHLASIIACCGIILDAAECEKLTDDRPPVNGYVAEDLTAREAHIKYLKEMFKGYAPHQNVITDGRE